MVQCWDRPVSQVAKEEKEAISQEKHLSENVHANSKRNKKNSINREKKGNQRTFVAREEFIRNFVVLYKNREIK